MILYQRYIKHDFVYKSIWMIFCDFQLYSKRDSVAENINQ